MRGLTVIVGDAARLRIALELAAAQAALGGTARIFCQGAAVAALRPEPDTPQAGAPTTAQLIDDSLALGVDIVACQSGLDLRGIAASDLDARFSFNGLIGILQILGEDRLVLA